MTPEQEHAAWKEKVDSELKAIDERLAALQAKIAMASALDDGDESARRKDYANQ